LSRFRRIQIGRSVNLVYHGHRSAFKYDYFGIHPSTEDRLTFIGQPDRIIFAHFIDCREESETWGQSAEAIISPQLDQVLVIPPGVAHTFDGLDSVYTLNAYRTFLPDPIELLEGVFQWSPIGDTVNLPRGVKAGDLPRIRTSKLMPSQKFYDLTTANTVASLDGVLLTYPLTRQFEFADGSSKLVRFTKMAASNPGSVYEALSSSESIGWLRNLYVVGGEEADGGYVVLDGPNDFRLFDHGRAGQHVSSLNETLNDCRRLSFLGHPDCILSVTIRTPAEDLTISVNPSPLRDMLIPPRATYAVDDVEGISIIERRVGADHLRRRGLDLWP